MYDGGRSFQTKNNFHFGRCKFPFRCHEALNFILIFLSFDIGYKSNPIQFKDFIFLNCTDIIKTSNTTKLDVFMRIEIYKIV